MHWVIQKDIHREEGFYNLISALQGFGKTFSIHRVAPFVGAIDPMIRTDRNVICIGSYSMRHVAKKKRWSPGVFDLCEVPFDKQRFHWGQAMLNWDACQTQFQCVSLTERSFVRPVDDSKVFPGKLFEPQEFEEWQEKVVKLKEDTGTSLTPDTDVIVSRVKNIYQEARLWVVKGKVVTQSLYKRGSKVVYDEDVDAFLVDFGKKMVEVYCPKKAFCLDVCETPEGPKIVEINTLNSAGFYAADMQKLVYALENMGYGE